MIALLLFWLVITGGLFCLLLSRRPQACLRGDMVPESFGVGAVLLHCSFLLASWAGPVGLWNLASMPLILGAVALWRYFSSRSQGTQPLQDEKLGRSAWFGIGLLLILQVVSIWPVLSLPLFDWDGRMLWALKARFLADSATVVSEPFRDPYRLHVHPRYPLLVPWMTSVAARLAGGFREVHYLLVVIGFAAMTTWRLFLALVSRRGFATAFLLSLVLVTSSAWYTAEINAQVEIILAFFLLAALVRFQAWLEGFRTRDLVLAVVLLAGGAMTKNEGLLAAMAVGLSATVVVACGQRRQLKKLWLVPLLFFLLYLPWLAHLSQIPAVSDENYLCQLNLSAMKVGFARLSEILRVAVAQLATWRLWHGFWLILPALVAWTLLRWKRVTAGQQLVALSWLLYVGGILFIYLISPWQDIVLHVESSFSRVVLPLFPSGLLLVGLWQEPRSDQ